MGTPTSTQALMREKELCQSGRGKALDCYFVTTQLSPEMHPLRVQKWLFTRVNSHFLH